MVPKVSRCVSPFLFLLLSPSLSFSFRFRLPSGEWGIAIDQQREIQSRTLFFKQDNKANQCYCGTEYKYIPFMRHILTIEIHSPHIPKKKRISLAPQSYRFHSFRPSWFASRFSSPLLPFSLSIQFMARRL